MTYDLEVRKDLYELIRKMEKKDRQKLEIINKKVKEILENPGRYKQLKAPMQHMRRVHTSDTTSLGLVV